MHALSSVLYVQEEGDGGDDKEHWDSYSLRSNHPMPLKGCACNATARPLLLRVPLYHQIRRLLLMQQLYLCC